MKSRELERAQHIQSCLDGLSGGDLLTKYTDRLKGAPAELMDNGLLQTLAFFHSKKEVEYGRIAGDIEGWLAKCGLLAAQDSPRALAALDAAPYRRCSEEAIAWLNLAKRLAAARVTMRGPS
ncbi:MAG: type III-B CRISPR module-associated protein Cmr5 [Candidatus Rokubacteria bacterium]|nr:type III-B CRISPR module-associated protein Cmr5 [Candidatus Rokubacteria bacterium]